LVVYPIALIEFSTAVEMALASPSR
jgi:hypothetical protein